MAPLITPHWEAVTPGMQELLRVLGAMPLLRSFYLAGGTGLALRLGHRISQDLDLFAELETLTDSMRQEIVAELLRDHTVERLQDSVLGLVLSVSGQLVSLFTYGYPLLTLADTVSGLQIAGLLDIGLMKLDAVVGRGTRKDFYDLYFIADHVPIDELFARSQDKYPSSLHFRMRALTALVDFDIAEQQNEPILLQPAHWEDVKAFFLREARRLGEAWFGDARG